MNNECILYCVISNGVIMKPQYNDKIHLSQQKRGHSGLFCVTSPIELPLVARATVIYYLVVDQINGLLNTFWAVEEDKDF